MKRSLVLFLFTLGLTFPVVAQESAEKDNPQIETQNDQTSLILDKLKNNTLSDDEYDSVLSKINTYIELLNRSSRGLDSWKRYTSWVDLKKGLTGKEKYPGWGLYSLYDDVIKKYVPKALEVVKEEPALPALDRAAQIYSEALITLHPIVDEANSYYSRQDYRDDQFEKGKELHPKLVAAFTNFIKAREAFDAELTPTKKLLDDYSLAVIEKTEGKKWTWHQKNIMMLTSRSLEVLADDKTSQESMNELVKTYSEATKEFDSYVRNATDKPVASSAYTDKPASILKKFRDMRDAKLKKDKNNFIKAYNEAVRDYNHMVSFAR